jgi:hypothetical protein
MSDELLTGELLTAGGRTGVIVGIAGELTHVQAEDLRGQLERRFPGVTFAIVGPCSGVAAFTFDDDKPGPEEYTPQPLPEDVWP